MIKYHGTPLTPRVVFDLALTGRNVLIPYPRPDNFMQAIEVCDKIILDNGAFSIWRQGGKPDWCKFYQWVEKFRNNIEFYFIPDVIDGTEEENDHLVADYFLRGETKGVPIWHVNESFTRLDRLINSFDYIAIGSAGEYAQLGTWKWHTRMNEAMKVMCDDFGNPKVKIHMLRCLNPDIFTRYPFYSGDSTNLAQNHKRGGWENILNRLEKHDSPKRYGELQGLFKKEAV